MPRIAQIRRLPQPAPIWCCAAVGLIVGTGLMFWTWARAAAMSADGAHYMELAKAAWEFGPQFGMDWYSGPGYPVAAGWVYGLVGELDLAGRLTSFLFGLATLIGVGILAYRMFGALAASASVGLLAVHTTFVRHAVMAETDTAYGCWLVWACLGTWELARITRIHRAVAVALLVGCFIGFGYLTRPEAIPLGGLLALWYLTSKSASKSHRLLSRAGYVLLASIVSVVVCSPYLFHLRETLGRWSLSGKERSIVLKFVPDKRNYEEVLKLGVTGALLKQPANLIHWLPYHLHWGIPQLVKSLHPVLIPFAIFGLFATRSVRGTPGSRSFILWVTIPFILFFFLTFPGRRYFMQALPLWSILAGKGTLEFALLVAQVRKRIRFPDTAAALRGSRRGYRIATVAPILIMSVVTWASNLEPIESSLTVERQLGQRILQIAGPGKRVLSFTVTAFHARAIRVPLWGPMEGIVRCHGYGNPLSYEDLKEYLRRHRVEYLVIDHDLRKDCPEFTSRVDPGEFELVVDDISDIHGPCQVYRVKLDHRSLLGN